ncbi:hypothetical protein PG999_009988 [Apiospora kogelbergensis]|uniref:Uncharacterized protein n=1 Tax=Apiospora kogelbergensis TaxID=1337665 RepID=A0AAW0QM38_9PEZI
MSTPLDLDQSDSKWLPRLRPTGGGHYRRNSEQVHQNESETPHGAEEARRRRANLCNLTYRDLCFHQHSTDRTPPLRLRRSPFLILEFCRTPSASGKSASWLPQRSMPAYQYPKTNYDLSRRRSRLVCFPDRRGWAKRAIAEETEG